MASIPQIKSTASVIFFICTQRPKLNPKFISEAHSSPAQDCRSSLICCFSLCPLPILSVSFQFVTGWAHTFLPSEKSHWEATTWLSEINDSVLWSLICSLRILPFPPVDAVLTSPWWMQSSFLEGSTLPSLGPRARCAGLSACREEFPQLWSHSCLMVCVFVHVYVCQG